MDQGALSLWHSQQPVPSGSQTYGCGCCAREDAFHLSICILILPGTLCAEGRIRADCVSICAKAGMMPWHKAGQFEGLDPKPCPQPPATSTISPPEAAARSLLHTRNRSRARNLTSIFISINKHEGCRTPGCSRQRGCYLSCSGLQERGVQCRHLMCSCGKKTQKTTATGSQPLQWWH